MNDQGKTQQKLLKELADLRQQVAEQEAQIAKFQQVEADRQQINDNLPVLIFTAGFDGYYKEVNAAFEKTLGWSKQEMLSRPFMEFVHPDNQAARMKELERVKSGKTLINFIDRTLCKDGSYRWVNWTVIPLPNRGVAFGTGKEITKQKQAEETLQKTHDELEERVKERTAELSAANEALRESEQKLKTLIEVSPDALVTCNLAGQVTFASHQALQMYRAESVEEMLKKNPLDFFTPEDQPRFLANIQKTLETGITRNIQYDFVRTDGTHFFGEASAAALHNRSGKPKGFVAILRDITERLQAETALEQERQSLWKMLQASDHERQTISYDIHDGLAQYLAAADMGFQTYDSMKENSPEEAQKAYEMAVKLVRQAHSEARRLIGEVRHPVIDERGLATAIVSLACEQEQRGGPKIECHTNVKFNRFPPILENALYRMAQEALTNARKHSKSEKVTVTMLQEGQNVRLEVQDWGTGFDTESTEKGHFGLESIRQRVRLLGGRLNIKSKPNSGTLIQVIVPILEKTSQKSG